MIKNGSHSSLLLRKSGRSQRPDIKIVLGDFNARVGKEDVFVSTVGKFSLHDETTDNCMRLIDFTAAYSIKTSTKQSGYLQINRRGPRLTTVF